MTAFLQFIDFVKQKKAGLYQSFIASFLKVEVDVEVVLRHLKKNKRKATKENAGKFLRELNDVYQHYIAFIYLKTNDIRLLEVNYHFNKQNNHLFEVESNVLRSSLSHLPQGDDKLKHEVELLELNNHYYGSADRTNEEHIFKLHEGLDSYYWYKKLKYTCELLNRQSIFKKEYDVGSFETVLTTLPKEYLTSNVLTQTYYEVYLFLKDQSNNRFEDLKGKLVLLKDKVEHQELRDLYIFLQNYCIKMVNQGSELHRKELFEIYQVQLENKLLLKDGQLYLFDYKNIATLGITLGELEWTSHFTKVYTPYLSKKYQKMAESYNMARIYFERKEYREAQKLLHQNIYTDVYYALGARSVLLKTYFEQEEFYFLESAVQSFKIFLRRSKIITETQRVAYLNFANVIYQLARDMDDLGKVKKHYDAYMEQLKVAETNWVKSKFVQVLHD